MDQEIKQILLVEDDFGHAELIRRSFRSKAAEMSVTVVKSLRDAQTAVSQSPPDLAIVDLLLPDGKGIEFLSLAGPDAPYPIIIMTSHGDEQVAVEAIKAGALDYVVKSDVTLLQMPYIADRALREWSHIKERKQTESLLRASEERFRQVISSISDHIYLMEIISEDEIIYRYLSPNCEFITGYSPSKIMADAAFWPSLVHPQDKKRIRAQRRLLSLGENSESEYRVIRADDRIIWVRDSARVKQEGSSYLVYGVISDVTERKSIEDELRQYQDHLEVLVAKRTEELAEAKDAAESANRAKSAFLANMSHELRTPLNAILGFAQLMERDADITPGQRENLGIISKSGEHLLALINDVLELSKIEAGRTTLIPTTFDLYDVVHSLIDMFRITAENKGLSLQVEMDEDLPQYIVTDEQKLRQVLTNLLSNAIKFTLAGHIILQVRLDARKDTSAAVYFAVTDTGPGVAFEEQSGLFDPFVQSRSGVKTIEGTGLGLPISRQFVLLMGGDLRMESRLGVGTTFEFVIQVAVSEPTAVILEEPIRRVTGIAPGQPEYRILIVEDKEYSRLLLRQLLETVGFLVDEAENGREAVQKFKEQPPHFIWMDMRMPVMNGYEATRQIRSLPHGKETYVLALTASAFEEERLNVLAAGCDDFVRKPFRESEIFERMTAYLGVEFLYDQQEALKTNMEQSRVEDILTPETLSHIPEEWLIELNHAAIRARADQITAVLAKIEVEHAPVAQAFAQLVEDFQFDKIMTLTNT
ncbi:MAG: response regulator [Anaerolineae bacterium]|nr:response regulator [Anaerolineae bacterium]